MKKNKIVHCISILCLLLVSCSKQTPDQPTVPPPPPPPPPPPTYTVPSISTKPVTNLFYIGGITGGIISSDGGKPVTERGICWSKTNQIPTIADNKIIDNTADFTDTIKGLVPQNKVWIRAYAVNSVGVGYGQVVEFRIPGAPSQVTDADGNRYDVVRIGDKYWTQQNFRGTKYNDGTPIKLINNLDLWLAETGPAMCYYDDNPALGTGLLYNGYAALKDNIAPKGWHVANDADIKDLLLHLDKDQEGQEMKSDNSLWLVDPNITDANRNKSKLSFNPCGYREGDSGDVKGCTGYRYAALFWVINGSNVSSFIMYNFAKYAGISTLNKKYSGASIRFVLD